MMNFSIGGGGKGSNNPYRRTIYHRHTPFQITTLEEFFKKSAHPDENQRRQLGRELGLDPKQIKFWFQNKRTQTKTQHEREDNEMLRAENERIQCENIAFREALKHKTCPSCGGPPNGEEELGLHVQRLQQENVQLKEEYEKVSNMLANCIGRPIPELDSSGDHSSAGSPPLPPVALSPGNSPNQDSTGSPSLDLDLGSVVTVSDGNKLPLLMGEITDVEKDMMLEAAKNAMDELLKLMPIDEPLWIKTSIGSGQLVLHRESYEKLSNRANHFRSSSARLEASKESRVVWMNAMKLVDMFLDLDKWVNLFPTIVRKAEILEVLNVGASGNRSGALQLMYEEMHIISPMVAAREFSFIRYCQQVETGVWAIADVSFDSLRDNIPISRAWKFPSGCLIHDLSNGFSKVTWIEHVEVDDKTQTHRTFGGLISENLAYGAERWVATLQRMCERFVFALDKNTPLQEAREVISSGDGRRSVMKLSNRMVKDFCEAMNMTNKEFPDFCEASNSGVRVSVRRNRNKERGQPEGVVITTSTSFWLPFGHQTVFEFLMNDKRRGEWDVLSRGNLRIQQIARISNGSHPSNSIRIIQPLIPSNERNMTILQETFTDSLGSMLVYAPVDMRIINMSVRGMDTCLMPILPSGFVISSDGHWGLRPRPLSFAGDSSGSSCESSSNNNHGASLSAPPSGGSFVTVTFQILACRNDDEAVRNLNVETVSIINSILSSAVDNIKVAFNCAGLD
ncbi:hypothetical protein QN277_009970 [Acacia crassicarpa]|uniref:Uncharacterized protein n=2 Tax=Acacia crassicarpa TaxID=499986 RepID=A0AAE1IQ38_9FABA|nr:hypothetical protein QN277_009970 [Acacia crassicarpa]